MTERKLASYGQMYFTLTNHKVEANGYMLQLLKKVKGSELELYSTSNKEKI